MGLSLAKKTELVGLSLAKRNVPAGIKMAVKATIDVSGSIRGYFDNGTIEELMDRLLPVAMRFDDNQSLEVYAFGSGSAKLSDFTASDFGNCVPKFLKEVPDRILWSGTHYGNALKDVNDGLSGGGFLGFGKKALQPSYLLFVTDGDTEDERAAEAMLQQMAERKIYVQLIGVGRGSRFTFLNRMADKFDHVGFVTFPDLEKVSDEQMYEQLLSDELCGWIKKL